MSQWKSESSPRGDYIYLLSPVESVVRVWVYPARVVSIVSRRGYTNTKSIRAVPVGNFIEALEAFIVIW